MISVKPGKVRNISVNKELAEHNRSAPLILVFMPPKMEKSITYSVAVSCNNGAFVPVSRWLRIWKYFLPSSCCSLKVSSVILHVRVSIVITISSAQWNRHALGKEQVVSSIPGSVGYISYPMPIEPLLHSCPGLATYWRMCKCCFTYLLTYLLRLIGSLWGSLGTYGLAYD